MIVPHEQLQPDTLYALIEEFVTRDGAVQGHTDTPLAAKMQAVLRQLEAARLRSCSMPQNETCSIVVKETMAGQQDEGCRIGEE